MSTLTLKIELLGYWHCGTGLGSGNAIDLSCQRDPLGLPMIPGRTLKGLLRDAMDPLVADQMFGRGADGERTLAGCLRVSDARVPAADRAGLPEDPGKRAELVAPLYRTLYQTAMDPQRHTALDRSLRAIEVALPLNLEAEVAVIPGASAPEGWQGQVLSAARRIHAIGKQRSRGLGRARITSGGVA